MSGWAQSNLLSPWERNIFSGWSQRTQQKGEERVEACEGLTPLFWLSTKGTQESENIGDF